MKKLNKIAVEETRNINGGSYYCKVCGKTSDSQWTIFSHIATNHIKEWGKNFAMLVGKVFL